MKLVILLLLWPLVSWAQTPAAIYNECGRQMYSGLCMAQNDGVNDAAGARMVIPGLGAVPMTAYRAYTSLAQPDLTKPGALAMCELAFTEVASNPISDRALVAQALWWRPEPARELSKARAAEKLADSLALGAVAAFAMLAIAWGLARAFRGAVATVQALAPPSGAR